MARGKCSPEQRRACPLAKHFTDVHHTQFPASDYKTKVEKEWREQPFNKVQLCRSVHNAIHATGYIPDKPDRELMVEENANGGTPLRAMVETEYQILIGRQLLQGGSHAQEQSSVRS